jgi:hypothetical protein
MRDFYRVPYFICLVALIGLLIIYPFAAVQAQNFKPLPEIKNMSAEEFASESVAVTKNFENDHYVSIDFSIQKDFTETPQEKLKNLSSDGRLYGTLVEYIGPVIGDVNPVFTVIAEEMKREVSLVNWFQAYAFDLGYLIEGLEVNSRDGSIEGFYINAKSNMISDVVRFKAAKIGPRVIIAQYSIPNKAYGNFSDFQIWTIKSVKIRGYDSANAEKRKYFAFMDALSFGYPESWRPLPERVLAPNKLQVKIINANHGEVAHGEITATVISARSVDSLDDMAVYRVDLKEELQAIKDSFAEKYKILPVLEKKNYRMPSSVKFNLTEIFPLEEIETQYVRFEDGVVTSELWFGIVVHGYKYYILTMITPARDKDAINWAYNEEAYKIVMESLVRDKDDASVEFVNEFDEIQNMKQ